MSQDVVCANCQKIYLRPGQECRCGFRRPDLAQYANLHPGHSLLKQLIPDQTVRRAWVAISCKNMIAHIDLIERNSRRLSNEECKLLHDFIESI